MTEKYINGWRPIQEAIGISGPLLVTNNPNARTAHGQMSHVWCVHMVHKNPNGDTGIEGEYFACNGPYSLKAFKQIEPATEEEE